jgi:ribonuclease P protein component
VRVRRKADFARAKEFGQRVRTPNFVLVITARPSTDSETAPRLGIVVSRRAGNAVRRNRAKRLIREAFRATRDLWMPGLDLVVIVTGSIGGKRLADVVDEWRAQTGRIEKRSARAHEERAARDASGES